MNLKNKNLKKNPPPLFLKELNYLVDKEVIVQSSSEYGSFGGIGILHSHGTGFGLDVVDKSKYSFRIFFNNILVKELIKNVIILHSTPENLKDSLNINNDIKKLMKKNVRVSINHNLWDSIGFPMPLIRGNFNYNKTEDIFYISKLNKLWLRLNGDCIKKSILAIASIGNYSDMLIQI